MHFGGSRDFKKDVVVSFVDRSTRLLARCVESRVTTRRRGAVPSYITFQQNSHMRDAEVFARRAVTVLIMTSLARQIVAMISAHHSSSLQAP